MSQNGVNTASFSSVSSGVSLKKLIVPFADSVISGRQDVVGVGSAVVVARVGIESQKALAPSSIVDRLLAVTKVMDGRVLMCIPREPFESNGLICEAPGAVSSTFSSRRIRRSGRHELAKSVQIPGSRVSDKSRSVVAKRKVLQSAGAQWQLFGV